jgi:SNF2 family DNA or RNA helicase
MLHGVWAAGGLSLWAEASDAVPARTPVDLKVTRPRKHPFALDTESLSAILELDGSAGSLSIALPSTPAGPLPSTHSGGDKRRKPRLFPWVIPAITIAPADAIPFLANNIVTTGAQAGSDIQFLKQIAVFGLDLLSRGRVLPTLVRTGTTPEARWRPVIAADDAIRLEELVRAMPPVCRAEWRALRHDPRGSARLVEDVLNTIVDTIARSTPVDLVPRRTRRRYNNGFVAWLDALTSDDPTVIAISGEIDKLSTAIDEWRSSAVGASQQLRTCFRLVPPSDDAADADPTSPWILQILLQSISDPSMFATAGDVWNDSDMLPEADVPPTQVLLRDLGRAARLYPGLDRLLDEGRPSQIELTAVHAAEFLEDVAPLLDRAGFGVLLPSWWGTKRARLNAKLKAKSRSSTKSGVSGLLGLEGIVAYDWQVSLGDNSMSVKELEQLVALKQPLVRVRGQWVHFNQTDLTAALTIAKGKKSDRPDMTAGDVLRVGLGLLDPDIGLPIDGVEATGWLGDLLEADDQSVQTAVNPRNFGAELRPYQLRGLAWLQFHDRFGLGACLADDMGLGKTAQLLALLASERSKRSRTSAIGPTLVLCPMSLVGNWQREAARFAPDLSVHVHHGNKRMTGDNFVEQCHDVDLVISTYQLATRDFARFERVDWHRVVLDEAQNIKNADASQARAVRALPSNRRIALTGTPIENGLSELWSIMEFLNPGLLGSSTSFRKQLATPIEKEHDEHAAERLRRITGPFILRRLKTDRSIITDLPEKLEIKTYCNLTREQASLYQAVVEDMLDQVENAEGIQRKGIVLAGMTRLKQVCNHPAHFLSDGSAVPGRSGKLERLEEIANEVIADGERMLIFTQFAEMGTMLQDHLSSRFATDVAWLHGGVPKKKRDEMVEQFQSGDGPPIFLLSLKAGGTGLTLTAANHVVHFDRWWNPAVENQATDRAFRIGQHRNVQVRKFVTVGTLEERIDEMIEQKKALADRIVGTGENWITELSTAALREVVALSADAVGEG